ncbi:MAG: hypothetical protein RLZZ537_1460 [Pseudomonadota bacterium]|jgi:hypothetical protein
MRTHSLIVVLLALAGCGQVSDRPSDPRTSAEDFRAYYFRDHAPGMPSRVEMEKLAPLLTRKFRAQFEAAIQAHECHLAKVGNSEPPLVQGDLLTSLFEGASSGGVGKITTETSRATAEMHWSYGTSELNAKPVNWTDALLLAREDGHWRVADIELRGQWDFAQKGLLSERLTALAETCR